MKIYPSILSADFSRLGDELRAIKNGGADGIHCDVMDGQFVPNITFGPGVVSSIRDLSLGLELDCHLMVCDPARHFRAFTDAGAHRVTIHKEACPNLHRNLQEINALKMKAGVSINPATPFEDLEWVLPELDLILIMSVNPGWGGQALIPQCVEKAARLKSWLREKGYPKILVQIDGGVNAQNAAAIAAAGVDIAVAGSSVFKSKDYKAAIAALKQRDHGTRNKNRSRNGKS